MNPLKQMGLTSINGKSLLNANGDIDTSSLGYKYITDTLTYIRDRVIEQKFFKVAIGDYIPLEVGEASWSEQIIQNLAIMTGGEFYEGDVRQSSGNGNLASVDAGLTTVKMDTVTWARRTGWTIIEIAKAAQANNWDVVETKLESLKMNWDLGIQETAFLGHPSRTGITGLINNSDVTINTTLITGDVSTMNEVDFQTFVAGLLVAYDSNSNFTEMPDTFVMPTSDYLGLGSAASATYPNVSKLEYLNNSLRKMSRNDNFQILPVAYCQADVNKSRGLEKDRYVLYRNEKDTLNMSIPVQFTMLDADTSNQFNWEQVAYGQYSGVMFNRPAEVLYLDKTSAS
jgi:hypothetical protein